MQYIKELEAAGDRAMSIKRLLGVLARVALSVIFAGVFYTAWMAVGLPIFKSEFSGRIVRAGIWGKSGGEVA